MSKDKIILGLVVVVIIILALFLIYKPSELSQSAGLDKLKRQIDCSCGCDYTLEDCEKLDPTCSVRPGIISRVNKMIEQGKPEKEILAAVGQFPESPAPTTDVSEDNDPVKGRADAPVTIIEFSDFECPYCATFYSQTLSQIEKEYIKTGKVKLVYRDFPLSFHQNAQKAAEAVECADEQDKFWEYHDLLFENQNEWNNIGISKFKEYARELGLNIGEFNQCLDSGEMASEVKKDFQDGQSYGVTGTPAFFVNGELLSGAQPFSAFKEKIDKFLE